jgi:AraC-like DNA-binding protein
MWSMQLESSNRLERSALESTYSLDSLAWAQLEPGAFEVRYGILDAPPLEISSRSMNVGFKAEADVAPHRFMLGLVADTRTSARWFGADVDEGHVATTRNLLALSAAGPSSFYQVTVDETALARQFPTAPDVLALMENVRGAKLTRDPIHAKRLRAICRRLFSTSDNVQTSTRYPLPLKSIYGTLIPLLAAAIEGIDVHAVEPSKCLTRRLSAVRACEAYMRDHVDATVTLLDLSQASGMRSRSLINAFEAITGFSPMDYLKRLRLDGVHRSLQRADKTRARIIDIATDWGFWHMGHFTTDYRAMFGETPSRTLLDS